MYFMKFLSDHQEFRDSECSTGGPYILCFEVLNVSKMPRRSASTLVLQLVGVFTPFARHLLSCYLSVP